MNNFLVANTKINAKIKICFMNQALSNRIFVHNIL